MTIRRILAAAAVALLATTAHADTIGMHIASWHSEPGFNNVNPGLYYRTDAGWTAGAYCNSESRSGRFPDAPRCKVSAYAGRSFEVGPFTLTAGVITGYAMGTVPMVLPSLKLGDHLRIGFVPKIDPKTGSHVVHAMWETEL